MKRFLMRTLATLFLAGSVFWCAACASPAGVPAPPIEVPTPIVLKFVEPQDLAIDFSTIAPAATPAIDVYEAVAAGGRYSDEISLGYTTTYMMNVWIRSVLQGISQIEIPIGETITTYAATVIFLPSAGVLLAGTHDVKVDFGDYDWNNDGTPEGCSGNTAPPLPICARVWLDGVRYLAWVFDAYNYDDDPTTIEANDKNVGAGRFKAYNDVVELALPITIMYDHVDPLDILSEFFLREGTAVAEGQSQHVDSRQTGPVDAPIKYLNFSTFWHDPDPALDMVMQYIGKYKEGEDFWSGSLNTTDPRFDNFSEVCAQLSTGTAAADQSCNNLGISVAGIDFVREATDADFAYPAAFTVAPTF